MILTPENIKPFNTQRETHTHSLTQERVKNQITNTKWTKILNATNALITFVAYTDSRLRSLSLSSKSTHNHSRAYTFYGTIRLYFLTELLVKVCAFVHMNGMRKCAIALGFQMNEPKKNESDSVAYCWNTLKMSSNRNEKNLQIMSCVK